MNTLFLVAGIIFFVGIIAILTIDLIIVLTKGFQFTISWQLYLASLKYPIIPALLGFFIGLLFGHLWWNQSLNITVNSGCTQ